MEPKDNFNSNKKSEAKDSLNIRKYLEVGVFITLVVLIITTLALYFTNDNNKQKTSTLISRLTGNQMVDLTQAKSTFFPDTVGGYIGEDEDWKLTAVQPMIVDFKSANGKNYITGSFIDKQDNQKTVDFVISGSQGNLTVENVWVEKSKTEKRFYTYKELTQELKEGNQIRFYYLSKIPTDKLNDVGFCDSLERLCNLSGFNDEYKVFSVYFELLD